MSRPVISFADAELVAVTILRDAITASTDEAATGVTVGTRKLPTDTGPWVLVRRVGGNRTTMVGDAARLDVLVWHNDDFNRMALAGICRSALLASPGSEGVQRCTEFLGPARLPDPADKARQVVMFTVSLTVRAPQS